MKAAGGRVAVLWPLSGSCRGMVVLAAALLGACAASEPPPPKLVARAPAPPPAPKPLSLVGMDSQAVTAALGRPTLERQDRQAQYWLYSDHGCRLALFLYLDPTTGKSRVTYYELRRPELAQPVADSCSPVLARLPPMAPVDDDLPQVASH